MVKRKKEISYIKKGALFGGIFGIILTLIYNFSYTPILNIFTYIPSLIGGILFTIQYFIFGDKLFGSPTDSILYFISFVIIIFYILVGMLIALIIRKYKINGPGVNRTPDHSAKFLIFSSTVSRWCHNHCPEFFSSRPQAQKPRERFELSTYKAKF